MEPRLISRGRFPFYSYCVPDDSASMEPRLISRGRANGIRSTSTATMLQWSRG